MHHRTTQQTPMTRQFADLETCAQVLCAPGATQITVGPADSHNGRQGATCSPPPAHTSSGKCASSRKTHSNAQGDHEVRALQQPPNAAHAERAISKQAPPSLYEVPAYSTRAGAAPRTPGGARHGGGNRAVTSQPRTGQSTSYGDVKSAYRGAGGWDRSGCAKGAPRSANRQGEEQHRHTGRGSHTKRDEGEHSRQGRGAQQGRRRNQNGGYGRACAWEAATTKGMAWPASLIATRCQGNPCSTGIRWGVSPAAQMGCLRKRSGSPLGADQP